MRRTIEAMGVGILVVVAGTAFGCGGGAAESGGEGGETGGGESAQYAGPIGSTDVAHGTERFQAVCAPCHENGAPALANIRWTAPRVRQQIREGEDQMRPVPVSRLSDPDMEAVLAYLQSIHAVTE